VQESESGGIEVTIEAADKSETITGTHILVAAGRIPNVEGLNLEAAGIRYSRRGIEVNKRLRTTNRKAYAIGDVAGGFQFTHMANYHAGLVIRNALFRLPVKVNNAIVPWVTFTDPELAHVGLTEQQAQDHGLKVQVGRLNFSDVERAHLMREQRGMLKVVAGEDRRILGATVLGPHADELIHEFALAIKAGLKTHDVLSMIHAYPTLSEAVRWSMWAFEDEAV
jgi:pyruvate/2-oxoglutarate dehydrogenase complex dihydrolipoamide dehydrogenase (E3) component